MDAMYSAWWDVNIDIGPTMKQISFLLLILLVVGLIVLWLIVRHR